MHLQQQQHVQMQHHMQQQQMQQQHQQVPTQQQVPVPAPQVYPSPLIPILDGGVQRQTVVKDPVQPIYTGFANFIDLARSACEFVPMNSNRAINKEVVADRVRENEENFVMDGRYLEFGQINLLVMATDPRLHFYVMDGQHRCETMRELTKRHPDRVLWFQFRAKVVDSEAGAFRELQHFQRSYPTDPRSFFRSRAENLAATAIVVRLKQQFPGIFREMLLSGKPGKRTSDPPRPYLNDNLVFGLLQEAGLLRGAESGDNETQSAHVNAVVVLKQLMRRNATMAELPKETLGKSATDNMRAVCQRTGCWLGFFREGNLKWLDIEDPEPASEQGEEAASCQTAAATATSESSCTASAAAAAAASTDNRGGAAGAPSECQICMDNKVSMALIPCGHYCVCEPCSRAILDQTPRSCPICRNEVQRAQRIYC